MLKELGVKLDEPKTLTEVKIRKAYFTLVGREPDLFSLRYFANVIDSGANTISNLITNASYGATTEMGQYIAQGNGNPVVNLTLRNFDNVNSTTEVAFNTNLQRRTDLGYMMTGDIISLPYEHEVYLQNKLASGTVNVNPFGVASFIGSLTLNPPDNSREFSASSTPAVFNDTNDAYTTLVNSFKAENQAKDSFKVTKNDETGFYGYYYGEWELISQGTTEINAAKTAYTRTDVYNKFKYDFSIIPSTVTSSTGGQRSDKVYDTNLNPKMGDVNIGFSASGMKPNTRVYAFFGDRAVSNMSVMYTQIPSGQDIMSRVLMTDNTGSIRGTFNYRESDLNFDAGIYIFALSDSISNSNNRTTYAAAPFTGLGLTGYGDETIRSRLGSTAVNKSSQVGTDSRTIILGAYNPETPTVDPKDDTGDTETTDPDVLNKVTNIDIIDFCFVYGLGRKPSAQEKAGIYDKWQTYDVHNITTWNSIQNHYASNSNVTSGTEMWYADGFPKTHSILTYVDRAVNIVPNGTDSADLRTKYLAAATNPYGYWNWWHLNDEPTFPATVNYTQFLNTDIAQALTAPWITDLSSDSFNADGRKVFNVLRTFVLDVLGMNGKLTPQDYNGLLGFAAREYGFIYYDAAGLAAAGTPEMPTTTRAITNNSDFTSSYVDIPLIWNNIGTDCRQPYKTVVSAAPTGPTLLLNFIMRADGAGYYTPPGGTVDTATGNVQTTNATLLVGGGLGPLWSVNQQSYPLALAHGSYGVGRETVTMTEDSDSDGAPDRVNWSFTRDGSVTEYAGPVGAPEADPTLAGTPYMLVGLHYGNSIAQILIGIKDGQTGEATNRAITIKTSGGGVWDTWIPATSYGYWAFTIGATPVRSNFVDVYNVYPGDMDPLNLKELLTIGAPFTLEIWSRDTSPTIPTATDPTGTVTNGYIDDGSAIDSYYQNQTSGYTVEQ